MEAGVLAPTTAAVRSLAEALGLPVDDAVVIPNSNKLAQSVLPCDAFARPALAWPTWLTAAGRVGLR